GIDGCWHGGVPTDSIYADDASLIAWADHGLATRAVLVDVPALRGAPWIELGAPVEGEEIDGALAATGVAFEPGDALLVYMGRDRYEAAGHELLPISDAVDGRPGLGASAAVWVADNGASILCWDFLDAHGHGADALSVHLLIWSIGLALIDNCALDVARRALAGKMTPTGMLSAAPLALPQATGCLVNPLLLY
ncbi:MAG TPA: cyclase family protein, partial [Acidimicrobiales bacterium]